MSDKELIKQEIEKRLSLLWDLIPEGEKVLKDDFTKDDANNLGKYTALENLLHFIDSLPEESTDEANCTTKNEDLEEACDNYYDETWDEHGGIAMVVNNCHDIWFPSQATNDFFKAGAEWQKKQMKETLQTEYEKGRFDMREEMSKNAVEGIIHHFADDELAAVHYNDPKGTPMSIYVSSKGLSAGDKVKIIIVKTEQQ